MLLSWSFLRLVLFVGLTGSFLLEQATGEQAEDVARSLGVADVNDWDIRSLYRVRFQHVTKRPPPGQRAAERKSRLATRWAALRERLADFFPSRHTNPRTVVTFDKIATDFVNVGIVKLAKALDPPKTPPKSRVAKKVKLPPTEPKSPEVIVPGVEQQDEISPATSVPIQKDVRPKRRVTLLVDLPDFDLQDFDSILEKGTDQETSPPKPPSAERSSKSSERSSPITTKPYPLLPQAPQRLVADSTAGCAGTASAHGTVSKFLCGVRGLSFGGDDGDVTRRKRSWSWSSSSSSNKVTQRPIGWNINTRPPPVQQYPRQQTYTQSAYPQQQYGPQQAYYMPVVHSRPSITVSFGRPTKSVTRQLVKAAVAASVVGSVAAYVKPVRPSTKSPAQRAEERERRRQQRLSRRSTTTTTVSPPEEGNSTTTPVPLAESELIPVMVQDANNLLQIVYVRRDQIPAGGMPIAMQLPFPAGSAAGQQTQQQQQEQQQQPSPASQPQLQAPTVNFESMESTTVPVLPTTAAPS
uniref:Uncharacterized protein n=1 Tax=Anopheles christyi TaxID=43041 RepID=A0A182KGH0_9DIPT